MEEPIRSNPLVHTRALLAHLLATYSKSRAPTATTSPILGGVKNLSIDSGVSSASTESEGADYETGNGTQENSTAPSSTTSEGDSPRDEVKLVPSFPRR